MEHVLGCTCSHWHNQWAFFAERHWAALDASLVFWVQRKHECLVPEYQERPLYLIIYYVISYILWLTWNHGLDDSLSSNSTWETISVNNVPSSTSLVIWMTDLQCWCSHCWGNIWSFKASAKGRQGGQICEEDSLNVSKRRESTTPSSCFRPCPSKSCQKI